MNKTICSLLVSLALLGCSSPAKKTYFYTLDKQTTQSELIKSEATTQLVVLDEIALADYLRQQGIIVKESRSRLQVSANHRWAESLDGALARHLRGELESKLQNVRFELKALQSTEPHLRIKLEVSQFEIDNTARSALSTGRYWIFNHQGELTGHRRFSLSQSLQRDGFEHAVQQLQVNLIELSSLLAQDLSTAFEQQVSQ